MRNDFQCNHRCIKERLTINGSAVGNLYWDNSESKLKFPIVWKTWGPSTLDSKNMSRSIYITRAQNANYDLCTDEPEDRDCDLLVDFVHKRMTKYLDDNGNFTCPEGNSINYSIYFSCVIYT